MRFRLAAFLAAVLLAAAPFLDVLTITRDPLAPFPAPLRPAYTDETPWAFGDRIDLGRVGRQIMGEAGWLLPSADAQFRRDAVALVFTVSPVAGGQFNRICNRTVSSPTSACVNGTALASITDSSVTKPYVVLLGPGRYDEAISIDNKKYVHLKGAGIDATIIRPTATNVDGGAISIANVTNTTEATNHIAVSDLTSHNDSIPEPLEAALNIHNETGGTVVRWTDILLYNLKLIGHATGFNMHGVNLFTEINVPRLMFRNSTIISGREGIGIKHNSRSELSDLTVLVHTAYCESTDTAELAQQQGVVAAGTASSVTLAGGESAVNNFYAGRRVHFVEGGGAGTCPAACTNATTQGWPSTYDGTTKVLALNSTLGDLWPNACTPTVECDYVIQAVTAPSTACTDVDWTTIAAPTVDSGTPIKIAGLVTFGAGAGVTAQDYLQIRNSTITVLVKDFGLEDETLPCGGEGHIAGILGYTVSPTGDGRRNNMIFDNVDVQVDLDMDVQDGQTCNPPVAGIHFSDDFRVDGKWTHSGRVIINNNADTDISVAGIASNSDDTGTLSVAQTFIQMNGTSGSEAHVFGGGTSGLLLSNVSSDELMSTTGLIMGWSEKCMEIENGGNTAYTDRQIPFTDTNVGFKVAYAACRCFGTCGASETFLLEDDGNNAIGTISCVDNTTALSWTDVRADADGLLTAGTFTRATNGTLSGTAGDDIMVCIRPTTTRFAP